jgi:hypothetical protein
MEMRTRRCSEREPADSLRDRFNIVVGWLPSLTFVLRGITRLENMIAQAKTKIRLWQLLLAILAVSFGLAFLSIFISDVFALIGVIVIPSVGLVTLAALYLADLLRWWRKR